MRKQHGIVLIGCGYIGKSYLEDISFRDQVRLIGTADVDQVQLQLLHAVLVPTVGQQIITS